jgi:cytochrome o ubiquinol oxidase subunit 1
MTSIADWLTSSDHKKIGRLFTCTSVVLALVTAILGAVIGFERTSPASFDIVDGGAAVQLTAALRYGLVFGMLAPVFVGLAILIVPLQVGARSIAFPRLAQFGFWAWFLGTVLVVVSLVANGGPGGGQSDMVDLYLMAAPLAVAGLLAATLAVLTTIFTSRAPGMTLDRVPPFTWSALVGGSAMVLSLPVMIGTAIYLYVDHTHARVAFGGNKAVTDHIGFAFSQPQTFVFAVMALGVFAEVAPVAARVRQPLRGVVLAGLALASTGSLGAVTQSTHTLSWSGGVGDKLQSALPWLFFNGLPLLGALVVIAGVALAFKSALPRPTAPLLFSTVGALMVLLAMAGNFVGTIESLDAAGTVFEEGTATLIAFGGLLAAIGGIVHWAPKFAGRKFDDKKVSGLAVLGLLGVLATAVPLWVVGLGGQKAGELAGFATSGADDTLNLVAGVGMALLALVVAGTAGLMLAASADVVDDPWDAQTLEWSVPSPAPTDNFETLATVGSPEPLFDVKPQEVSV